MAPGVERSRSCVCNHAVCRPLCTAQKLQKGVSVELAVTRNAVAMPDADNEGALIVAVTHSGSVYFGIDPITPAALAEKPG